LSDGTRGFDYDDENQLIRVTVTNGWKSEFSYDGRMRRRIRKEFTWQNSAWVETNEVRYIYDGNLPIQERDINNLPLVTYTRGNDLSGSMQGAGGIGGLLARTVHSTLYTQPASAHAYYHADGNGNIAALINTNQAIVARYVYDPFGGILSQSGPVAAANLYRFSSKEHHPNSGLVYHLYRFHEPNLQRWLNRDPFGERGFQVLSHGSRSRLDRRFRRIGDTTLDGNQWTFVSNNPLRYVDRWGLDASICERLEADIKKYTSLLGDPLQGPQAAIQLAIAFGAWEAWGCGDDDGDDGGDDNPEPKPDSPPEAPKPEPVLAPCLLNRIWNWYNSGPVFPLDGMMIMPFHPGSTAPVKAAAGLGLGFSIGGLLDSLWPVLFAL
jgi:RHS repeat-associated protein